MNFGKGDVFTAYKCRGVILKYSDGYYHIKWSSEERFGDDAWIVTYSPFTLDQNLKYDKSWKFITNGLQLIKRRHNL